MKINYCVDKRAEVMEILLFLTNYFNKYPDLKVEIETEYIKDVKAHFLKFKNHKAVKILQKIIDTHNFCYDAPICLAYQLKTDYSFSKLPDYPFQDRLGVDEIILVFLKELKNFVVDSDYEKFYEIHKPMFKQWLKEVKTKVDNDVINWLNNFYKEELNKKYYISLMPLQTNANYGIDESNKSICNFGIKYNLDQNKTSFCFANKTKFNTMFLLQHEFSHPLINPLVDKFLEVDKLATLPKDVVNIIENLAYNEGANYVDEQIIRATTIIYLQETFPDICDVEGAILDEEEQGFIHTRAILKALKKYQKQNLPLSSYFPKLLKEFYKPIDKIISDSSASPTT